MLPIIFKSMDQYREEDSPLCLGHVSRKQSPTTTIFDPRTKPERALLNTGIVIHHARTPLSRSGTKEEFMLPEGLPMMQAFCELVLHKRECFRNACNGMLNARGMPSIRVPAFAQVSICPRKALFHYEVV